MSKKPVTRQAISSGVTAPVQVSGSVANSNHTTSPAGQTQAPTNGAVKTSAKNKIASKKSFSYVGKAYPAALLFTGVIVQIFAIIATAAFYFYFPPIRYPIWYAPIYGVVVSLLLWLICAAGWTPLANAQGANARSYGLLCARLNQLNARLGIEQLFKNERWKEDEKRWTATAKMDKSSRHEEYQLIALREAHRCYDEVDKMLFCERNAGVDWVLGMGYINAWSLIHRAEEALIEIEPVEMVIRGAMHDKMAIQNSAIENRDEILRNLIRAVIDINADEKGYFSEHQLDRNSEAIVAVWKKLTFFAAMFNARNTSQKTAARARGRTTLREIRRTLNDYRDTLWEGLVRERNHLLATIAITGSMTHILLCVSILTVPPDASSIIIAAASFYFAGAVAGLFGKISFESENDHAIDDYGLSVARLIAIPLLSGLAAVGGVLLTALLSEWGGLQNLNFTDIFAISPSHLLTAALFGLTPNLLVKSFQIKTNKYLSELQNSKGAVSEKKKL